MTAPVVLAFGFVSPVLLWGLLLAGVPVLIQWLHRRKYTERVWAAMRFLKAATASQSRRLRMESLLLLCVRTLILLLAAVALAEPYLESSGWRPAARQSVHTLILLDASLSMQATVDGTTVAEEAKDAARSLVRSGRLGDSYQLLTLAKQPAVVVSQPSFSAELVLAEIDRLPLTESYGDVPAALARAERALAEAPSAGVRRIAIISDFQRTNWQLEEPAARDHTQQALHKIAKQASILLLTVGSSETPNALVEAARMDSPLVAVGAPTTITAQVRNWGAQPQRQLRLQLVEDGRVLQSQAVDVPAYAEAAASFVVQWSEPGPHAVQFRLGDDALSADNDRWATVDVRQNLQVLLVNGRVSDRPLEGATDFVELALRPPLTADAAVTAARPSDWVIQPTSIREADLIHTDLSQFDCIFACDVPFFSDDEISRLEQFVGGGGGLAIGMGDQVQLDSYARQLDDNGEGLLPVQLVRVVGEGAAEAEPFHFTEPASDHPLLQSFVGNPRSGLTTANIYRYVETRLPKSSAARTVLAFGNGAPAIIEHNFGSGRVVLVTTSLDDRWGSWALWPNFLPMLHELVEYLVTTNIVKDKLVGESLQIDFPPNVLGKSIELQQPDGRRSTLHPVYTTQSAEVSLDETAQSGVYRVTVGEPAEQTRLLAVNIDSRESDLRSFDADGLRAGVLGAVPFEWGRGAGLLPTRTAPEAPSKLTGRLLLCVLVLLLVEQVMAWNSRYGLLALAAGPIVVAGFAAAPAGAVALIACGLMVAAATRWRLPSIRRWLRSRRPQ